MLDIKTLHKAIEQLAAEKDLDRQDVLDAVEAALASAYKKEYGKRGEIVRAVLNEKTGDVVFTQVKTVVDDTTVRFPLEGEEVVEVADDEEQLPLYNPDRHILLEEAKKEKEDVSLGDEISFPLPAPEADFGRIAAQTAKQVVLQKLREIEKDAIRSEFEDKIGDLVSGVVQRVERGNVFVDLGRASGMMHYTEAIPGERYRIGERLKFYLLRVQDGGRGPNLVLSRSHPHFITKLFELEVPEIADGVVEIKEVIREPGSRSKVAVYTDEDGVDPVGSCVGQRGARVMAVNSEIGAEKIDIVEWSEDLESYIAASLSPATVTTVELIGEKEARVLVPDDQLSLAIGKRGQNVRLAAKLTGARIDIRSQANPEQVQEEGIADTADAAAASVINEEGEEILADRSPQGESSSDEESSKEEKVEDKETEKVVEEEETKEESSEEEEEKE